jgi:hypothetical protein
MALRRCDPISAITQPSSQTIAYSSGEVDVIGRFTFHEYGRARDEFCICCNAALLAAHALCDLLYITNPKSR